MNTLLIQILALLLRGVKLPTPGAGIRKMIVDARGQLWHMGSQNGRLGRVR
jgi:hypothetical protein